MKDHLRPVGKPGAAAAAQARLLHDVDDGLRDPASRMALVLSHWPRFFARFQAGVLQAVEIGEDAVLVGEHQAAPGGFLGRLRRRRRDHLDICRYRAIIERRIGQARRAAFRLRGVAAVLRAGLDGFCRRGGRRSASRSSGRPDLRRSPCRSGSSARSRRRPGTPLPSSENLPSAETVCWCGWMCFLQAATTSSEPRSQQGVVVQTCTRWSPTGCRLNMV